MYNYVQHVISPVTYHNYSVNDYRQRIRELILINYPRMNFVIVNCKYKTSAPKTFHVDVVFVFAH